MSVEWGARIANQDIDQCLKARALRASPRILFASLRASRATILSADQKVLGFAHTGKPLCLSFFNASKLGYSRGEFRFGGKSSCQIKDTAQRAAELLLPRLEFLKSGGFN
jgi:hypothetical protein